MEVELFDAKLTRLLLAVVEILGLIGGVLGLIMAIGGFAFSDSQIAIVGVWLFAGGFLLLVAASVGRAVVNIAETNEAILEKLRGE